MLAHLEERRVTEALEKPAIVETRKMRAKFTESDAIQWGMSLRNEILDSC